MVLCRMMEGDRFGAITSVTSQCEEVQRGQSRCSRDKLEDRHQSHGSRHCTKEVIREHFLIVEKSPKPIDLLSSSLRYILKTYFLNKVHR